MAELSLKEIFEPTDTSFTPVSIKKDRLRQYLQAKGSNHKCYSIYTNQSKAALLKETCCISFGTGHYWNDARDRERFISNSGNNKRFGRCFSFSQSENVAMWMLYGGLQRTGAMIRFSRKAMRAIINIGKIEIGYYNNGFTSYSIPQILTSDKYTVYFSDILYTHKEENGSYTVKRGDEVESNIDFDVTSDPVIQVKQFGWNYENEVRVVFEIPRDIITDIEKKFGIDKSPNMVQIDFSTINRELLEDGIKFIDAPNASEVVFQRSEFQQNDIDWDLCKDCAKIKK